MDLSAVFSLAAVNGCAGQDSARSKHYRNPKGDIAVVAGLRRSGIAGLVAAWLIGIRRRLGRICCPRCGDFHRRFLIAANGAFLVPRACFCGSRFLIRYPLKSVGGFVQLLAALAGVPMVRFIGMPACSIGGMFRQLRNNRICKGNLFCTGFIAEIFTAAVAVPVLDVALGHMRRWFRFGLYEVCVVGSVYFPVFLAADVADCFLRTSSRAAVMLAFITAFRAYAVLPFVYFFCYDWRIAAAICAGMGSRCLCPNDSAGMIIRIDCSIGVSTGFADCRCSTGRFAAGAFGFVEMGIAAILAFMVMLSVFLRPCAYCLMIISVIVSVLASANIAYRKL